MARRNTRISFAINLIDLKPDGSFRLNLDYFNYCTGLTMTNERFDALFGGRRAIPRRCSSRSTWTSRVRAGGARRACCSSHKASPPKPACENLCSPAARAQCVANGKGARGRFRDIWIQPAAGDAGGALGAALPSTICMQGTRSLPNTMMAWRRLSGPEFDQAEIERRLGRGAHFTTTSGSAQHGR